MSGDVAKAWIKMACSEKGTPEHEENFWAFSELEDLGWDDPESAWGVILEILALDAGSQVMELLSAGPLEDLLARHGDAFIERVEREAKKNARFASLLGGVWRNSISEAVWARVLAVRDRRGWDAVPSA